MARSQEPCLWKVPSMPGGPGDRRAGLGQAVLCTADSRCLQGRSGQGPVLSALQLAPEEDQHEAGTPRGGRWRGHHHGCGRLWL